MTQAWEHDTCQALTQARLLVWSMREDVRSGKRSRSAPGPPRPVFWTRCLAVSLKVCIHPSSHQEDSPRSVLTCSKCAFQGSLPVESLPRRSVPGRRASRPKQVGSQCLHAANERQVIVCEAYKSMPPAEERVPRTCLESKRSLILPGSFLFE